MKLEQIKFQFEIKWTRRRSATATKKLPTQWNLDTAAENDNSGHEKVGK